MQTTYRSGRGASALVKYMDRETGADDLLNYMDREETPLRSAHGQPLSDPEREAFIEKSRKHEFVRDMIVSPENGQDLSARELSQGVRSTMNDFLEDRPTASYIYALHEDTEHPHAHVALTGERRDLYMNREDIDQVRDHANEQLVEQYQHRSRDHEQDQGHEHEHDEEHQQDRDEAQTCSVSDDRDAGHKQETGHDSAKEDTDRSEDRDTGEQGYGR
jgi:hypothetical protein